jgi:hypothetical protein
VETRSVANRNKRSSAVGGGSESLEQEVSDLLTLDTSELREKWSMGVGHREIARREDSRNLADLRPPHLSLGPHARANRAHTRGFRSIL